ncbi:nucleoside triphosphate pyrophosphatase [Blastococcus sp. Marseille-P5729]|uniref:Maf family protein n=1 Tax=Blastococcus sp. Marseille-P5729 TaxID=2086582 RepID=UPI000D1139DD|nr:nucleoside triphosphate pyrophosphatase [Blastococcus sp. Marseille-P5729]
MRFVLASRSPARLATLQAAGIEPEVLVSDVDEDSLLAGMPDASPQQKVIALAEAKAREVSAQIGPDAGEAVVIACDSMFEMDGEVRGKPADAQDAVRRLRQMRSNHGTLHTGHHVIAGERSASAAASTEVHIGPMTDEEIAAYVATGEPLHVAGSFTIDGLGGWFIEKLEGDHTNVVGISLPLVRRMLLDLDIDITQYFNKLSYA